MRNGTNTNNGFYIWLFNIENTVAYFCCTESFHKAAFLHHQEALVYETFIHCYEAFLQIQFVSDEGDQGSETVEYHENI